MDWSRQLPKASWANSYFSKMVALQQAAQRCQPRTPGLPLPARPSRSRPAMARTLSCRPVVFPAGSFSLFLRGGSLGLSRRRLGPARSRLSTCWPRARQSPDARNGWGPPRRPAAQREITPCRRCLLNVDPSERPEPSEKAGDGRTGPRGRRPMVLEDSHPVGSLGGCGWWFLVYDEKKKLFMRFLDAAPT